MLNGSSVILLITLVVCTTITYGQDIVANSAFTGHSINLCDYAGGSSLTRIYTADSVKHYRYSRFTDAEDGSDEAVSCVVAGALLSAIGGITMLATQHDQNSWGFKAGAGCTVFGGVFVLGGGWAYLIIKLSDRHQRYSLIVNKSRAGIAYNF